MPQPARFLLPTRPSRVSSWLLFVTRHSCFTVVYFPPRACFHICFCHHLMRDILFPVSYLLGYIIGWGGGSPTCQGPSTFDTCAPLFAAWFDTLEGKLSNSQMTKPYFHLEALLSRPEIAIANGRVFLQNKQVPSNLFFSPFPSRENPFSWENRPAIASNPSENGLFFQFFFFSAY